MRRHSLKIAYSIITKNICDHMNPSSSHDVRHHEVQLSFAMNMYTSFARDCLVGPSAMNLIFLKLVLLGLLHHVPANVRHSMCFEHDGKDHAHLNVFLQQWIGCA